MKIGVGQFIFMGAGVPAAHELLLASLKKWEKIPSKQGKNALWWGMQTDFYALRETFIPVNMGFANSNSCACGAPEPMKIAAFRA
jgi:hypothetical protein